ncbi:MAG: class B sortase [Lachnospiraceae bacterium]|nr:class B sortase [Lachnospiraceae bacterium]
MAGFEVAGRRFRTEADYKAALRDQAKIKEIRIQVNMEQPGEVITLYTEMQTGKYRFETTVGNDFDDEIYELAQEYKRQGYDQNSKLPAGRKKALKKKGSKQAQAASVKKSSGRNAEKQKKAAKKNKNADVSLDAYDKNMQKEILRELKKREKRRKLTVLLCSVVAVVCFGYFSVYYYFSGRTQMNYENLAQLKGSTTLAAGVSPGITIHYTEEEEIELEVLEEYQTLYNKNKSLIGWLKIDDTNIDYPVMQTANNEYYLDHNYNQEYDKNGSLFLDKDCDVVHRSTNLIIYGHHMKSGKMFGNLNKYSSEDYYKNHSTIQFDTIYEKGTYEVMYVFRSRIYNEDEVVFKYYQFLDAASEKEFESNMQEMAALSLYDTGVTASYGDELLTLSTCDNSEADGRFVVVAKRVL